MSKFPNSWKKLTLDHLCGQRGQSINPSKTPDRKFELYSVPSFPDHYPEIVCGKEIGSNKQLVEPRSVLLCKINPRINRVWVVDDFTKHTKIASTEWIVFPSTDEVQPEFLCYFLQQHTVRDFLAHNASGVGGSLTRVKPSILRDFPFAYPKLPEQKRIVAEIEKQFTRLDAGVAALRRVQANLKRYRAAVLKSACEGKLVPTEAELAKAKGRKYETGEQLLKKILTERRKNWSGRGKYKEPAAPDTANLPELPEGWAWISLDQSCSKITDGEHLSPTTTDEGVCLLSAKDVREQGVLFDDPKFVSAGDAEQFRKRCDPERGDVLIVSRGATIGRICVVQTDAVFCLMGSVILLKPCLPISGKYLSLCLAENRAKVTLGLLSGSTAQQAIYIRDIRPFSIPLPPLAEQTRIVEEVERRLSMVDELESLVGTNLQRATKLRQSILQKAFSGEL